MRAMFGATMFAALVACSPVLSAKQSCATGSYPASSPDGRFVDNADGTVTDAESRLMWMRCSAGQVWSGSTCGGEASLQSWQAAQVSAVEINRRGTYFFSDWRLPRLHELATIAERQCENPRVNLSVFPATPADVYWTATSRPRDPAESFAFVLGFGASGIAYEDKSERHRVRLVRDSR